MYTENESAIKRIEAALNNLLGELHTIAADDKVPYNC